MATAFCCIGRSPAPVPDNIFPTMLQQFKEWLETFPDDAVVGISHDMIMCPIATFMSNKELTSWSNISNIEYITWVVEFIRRIDGKGGTYRRPVSAREARKIVDDVWQHILDRQSLSWNR